MDSELTASKKSPPLASAERQRRYRERHKTHAVDVKADTYSKLLKISERKGWSVRQTISEALVLLQTQLDAEAHSALVAELHKRAVEAQAKFDKAHPPRPPEKSRKPNPAPAPEDVEGQGSLLW